jgi:hypothetical protein
LGVDGWKVFRSIRPGTQTNHIELKVDNVGYGHCDMAISVNGRTLVVVYNQPSAETFVGMTLYGHSIEVSFDNFEFESYPPFGAPIPIPETGQVTG